ncbi:alginate lyase family protein [Aurantiacibacter luteus]|uniref:alginate lyase family protein n=1 Tax=Aurantiacibacter luteus TaxID=1581420 RepID=UPI0009E31639|nr:alginate lyase family protein [Aurantiacibacter luteus]
MLRVRTVLAALALLLPASLAAQDRTVVPAFAPAEGQPQCRGAEGYAADFGGARTFLWRPAWVEGLTGGEQRAAIVRAADEALERGPYSVTDKPRPIPGAAANDYASIGPYWWPDRSAAGGLPYVRRDGEVNPERDGPEFDRARLRALGEDMKALALAWHATRDDRYAEHAALLARTWFLDPATRMNPHFNFAQGIPGRVTGRGEGIIESLDLATTAEALGLLAPSGALSAAEQAAIRQWYGQFAVWMSTSPIGEEEMAKRNNHGVFYDAFLAHFALVAGAEGPVRNLLQAFPDYRLAAQMDRQGRFIEELGRTRSWHYSHFVVEGAARLATLGECVGLDLWDAQLADGRSLQTARTFLERYAEDPSAWPFPDTDLAARNVARMRQTHATGAHWWQPTGAPARFEDMP